MTDDVSSPTAPDLLAQDSELALAEKLRAAVANVQTAADLAAYYSGGLDTLADLEKARSAADDLIDEVERLTAEVALYRERDGLTRKALQTDGDGPLQFAAVIVRQQRDKAEAEVSRLREQLAAQPPRHKVEIHSTGCGYRAECTVCKDWYLNGREELAEDWRDQHEADTLRPVSAWDLLGIAREKTDEGRPSGSERLAPHSDDDLVAHLRNLVTRLKNNVRTGEEKGLPNEIAFDDGWFGALVHAGNELETLLDQYGPNGWDPAAQAARSGATPEDLSHVCACDHGKADHRGFLPGCAACACREFRPSPSLRNPPPSSVDEGNPDR